MQIYTTTTIKDIAKAIENINSNLYTISTYSKSFGSTINPSKSQVAGFGSSKQLARIQFPFLPPILFNNVRLEYYSSVKNLEIIMDNTFSWRLHIVLRVRAYCEHFEKMEELAADKN